MALKRFLCSLFSLALVASLFPTLALAAEEPESSSTAIAFDERAVSDDPIAVQQPDSTMGSTEPVDESEPTVESDAESLDEPMTETLWVEAEPQEGESQEASIAEQATEAPLGNGPENSWRFDNGRPISPDAMVTDGDGTATLADIRDGMYTTFETFDRGYCTGAGAARGIDVSRWQGSIDWAKVKAAGIDFAIIRCGYGDDLPEQDDEYFIANVRGCLQNNIPFGVYLYSYATGTHNGNEGALSEANHVLRCLRNAGLTPAQVKLPVYLDMEHDGTLGADLYAVANTFCGAIQSAGYTPGVYANTTWWNHHLTHSGFNGWSRWIAQYNTGRGVEFPFRNSSDIWQFSSKGSVAGVPGNVDLNYSYLPQAYGGAAKVNTSEYKLVYDYASYKAYNPKLSFANEAEAFNHFLKTGMATGLRASEVFDPKYYKDKYSDLRKAFGNNWASYYSHFLKNGAAEGRQGSSNFDVLSYYNANPDLRAAFGLKPALYYEHYINYGKKEKRTATGVTAMRGGVSQLNGKNYSAVYDSSYYLSRNADVARAYTKKFGNATVVDDAGALKHFITYGMKEGRASSANFDLASYYNANPDLRAAFGIDPAAYYTHYMNYGQKEKRTAAGVTALRGSVNKLNGKDYSAVYDSNYYLSKNADVARAFTKKLGKTNVVDEKAALNHFITYGMKEGRASKASFDLASYYNANPDLRAAFGIDPAAYYTHYMNYGQKEKRTATGVTALRGSMNKLNGKDYSAVYDSNYYLAHNADVAKAYTTKLGKTNVVDEKAALNHFIKYGMKEGRASSPDFSWETYRDRYADLRAAFGDDKAAYYTHYMNYGKAEGRTAI